MAKLNSTKETPQTNTVHKPPKPIHIQHDPKGRVSCVPWPEQMVVYVERDGSWFPNDSGTFNAQCPCCLGSFSVTGGRACFCPWCGGALDKNDAYYCHQEHQLTCPKCDAYVPDGNFCNQCGGELHAERFEGLLEGKHFPSEKEIRLWQMDESHKKLEQMLREHANS